MKSKANFNCPCCGHHDFVAVKALWPKLIQQWGLNKNEVASVDRQQGLHCRNCGSNLRSMTLAKSIMLTMNDNTSTLKDFAKKHKHLKILEVNEAGHLTKFFEGMPNHVLALYPEVDIHSMPSYKDDEFDLVIHSDTLEHVKDPIKALAETLRVLKPGGYTCYTVPMVVGRLSKTRPKNEPSYHGSEGNNEYLVYTEYGSDAWTQPIEAGFMDSKYYALEYPSSLAITAKKTPTSEQSTSLIDKLIRVIR